MLIAKYLQRRKSPLFLHVSLKTTTPLSLIIFINIIIRLKKLFFYLVGEPEMFRIFPLES